RERIINYIWIPVFAGMTEWGFLQKPTSFELRFILVNFAITSIVSLVMAGMVAGGCYLKCFSIVFRLLVKSL
ncbi:hypothetical protein TI03_04035, partial [Achromatium sp. WMS1]